MMAPCRRKRKGPISNEIPDKGIAEISNPKEDVVKNPDTPISSEGERQGSSKVARRDASSPITRSTHDERIAKIKFCIRLYALELGEMPDEVLKYVLEQHLVRQGARLKA